MENTIIEAIQGKRVIRIKYQDEFHYIAPVVLGVINNKKILLAFHDAGNQPKGMDEVTRLTKYNYAELESAVIVGDTFTTIITNKELIKDFSSVLESYH